MDEPEPLVQFHISILCLEQNIFNMKQTLKFSL